MKYYLVHLNTPIDRFVLIQWNETHNCANTCYAQSWFLNERGALEGRWSIWGETCFKSYQIIGLKPYNTPDEARSNVLLHALTLNPCHNLIDYDHLSLDNTNKRHHF